ncbi:MAG: capsule assembly Wzi family protein [Pseudomonadota bacterium]
MIAVIAAALFPALASAELWSAVDDRQMRSDVELLADYGVIRGPIATWPINWSQLRGALELADVTQLPSYVRDAHLRLSRLAPNSQLSRNRLSYELDVAGTNEQAIIRGYGAQSRGDYDSQARVLANFGGTYLSLSVGLQDENFGSDITFDNTYIAQQFGNWIAYAGTVERWWGPGWTSSLIFSTSARPQPQIGIRRNEPDPFTSKWLRWIGPWSLDIFVSRQDEDTGLFDNDLIAGIRLEIQPIRGMSIGFTRGIQLCGEDRPCGFSTWTDALIAIGDRDNTGTLDEPGNQMAGVTFRYGSRLGKLAYSLFLDSAAEDEDGTILSVFSVLYGARLSGPWGDSGARWEAILEYSDTLANRSLSGPNRPNITYQNFIYSDGWRYRGRSLGASQDNDTRLISLSGHLTDTKNRFYRLTYHYAEFNSDGTGPHTISLNAETINILEGETIWPTRFGDVRGEVRLQDDEPNTPDTSSFAGAIEISYQLRF